MSRSVWLSTARGSSMPPWEGAWCRLPWRRRSGGISWQSPWKGIRRRWLISIFPSARRNASTAPFFQNGTNQDEEDRYIDHLVKDIEMGADSPRLSSAPIQAVFIGGGTPTSLSPENAGRLLSTSRDVCRLPMTTNSPSKAVCMTSSRRRWTYGSETA